MLASRLFVGMSIVLVGCAERSPLAEPLRAEYFHLPASGASIDVERVRNISSEDFDAKIRRGVPFIIEDAGRDNSLVGSTCEQFHERFPGAKMRAEYTGGPEEKFISLGGSAWYSKDRLKKPQEKHLTKGSTKLNAPYVWHVKDGGDEAPPEVRAAVQRIWQPPYFIKGSTNLREANESVEFWFSRRKGAVLAHADTYCIPAVSFQLHGQKQWQLMPSPEIASVYERYNSQDGGIYKTGLWRPTHHATLSAGEAIVFFPNLFHETFIPEDNPPCTVAMTFQFQLPVPTKYLRAFLPTHTLSHLYYEQHCKDLWHSYATLQPPGAVKPSRNKSDIATDAFNIFATVDADGDGSLTVEELQKHLSAQTPAWPRWFLTEDYFYDWRPSRIDREIMSEELLTSRAADTLAFQDTDEDGVVSSKEFLDSLMQWHVLHWRVQKADRMLRKGTKKEDVLRFERQLFEQYRESKTSVDEL